MRHVLFVVALFAPALAVAQTAPGPPGPYVIDLRGAMMGVPAATEFYPDLPASSTVPGRAFGLDIGGHVLAGHLGSARVGIGANAALVRGRVGPPDVATTLTVIAPQFSLNFGTHDGWSYLGAGYGPGQISSRVSGSPDATAETGTVGTLNVGGGARWFTSAHVAAGFDVRFYRFGAGRSHASPATTSVALSVGVSLR